MNLKSIAAVSLVAVSVSACAGTTMGEKQTVGGVLGAIGGGVAGAQFGKGNGQLVGVAAGTLLGALIGSEAGKSLDRADQLAMGQTVQKALETSPSNAPVQWSNPDSGHSGAVTPKPAYTNTAGRYCREFQQTIVVGGQEQSAYGTACRQPDGSWQIANAANASAPHAAATPMVTDDAVAYVPPRHPRARTNRHNPYYWR